MQCVEASELMSLSMDAQLGPEDERLLAEHLLGCDVCREELEDLRSVSALFDGVAMTEPPPTLRVNVMAAVARRQSLRTRTRDGLIVLVAALLVSGVGLLPLVGVAATAYQNPSVFNALLQATLRLSSLVSTLLGSLEIIARAVLLGPCAPVVAGSVVAAVVGTVLWFRLVTFQGRRARALYS